MLAEELRELADRDERLGLATVTSVDCDPDFRRAVVYLSSLDESEAAALAELRVRMQAAISRQVRLKRTPLLSFAADPAMQAGQRVEEILRDLGPLPDDPADGRRDPGVR
ncbi:MAG: ribosome-binding factor A [Acidimicrobiales bacterium]